MLQNLFGNKKKLECPMVLNPKTTTLKDLAIHMEMRQRLQSSTIEKSLRYTRFMKNHKIPVDYNKPDYTQFIRHMDHRERVEQATPEALRHEWRVMRRILKAYNIHNWSYRAPPSPRPAMRVLPFPEKVNDFLHTIMLKTNTNQKCISIYFSLDFWLAFDHQVKSLN